MENNELQRGLNARQMQMIALGGTIGVGLLWEQQAQLVDRSISYSCIFNCWYFYFNHESHGEMIY